MTCKTVTYSIQFIGRMNPETPFNIVIIRACEHGIVMTQPWLINDHKEAMGLLMELAGDLANGESMEHYFKQAEKKH